MFLMVNKYVKQISRVKTKSFTWKIIKVTVQLSTFSLHSDLSEKILVLEYSIVTFLIERFLLIPYERLQCTLKAVTREFVDAIHTRTTVLTIVIDTVINTVKPRI